ALASLTLTGCATVTLPDGSRVSKEVYRAEAAQDLMTLAVAADREYDSRNPITPPPSVCADGGSLSGADLAYCAMAMATYNAQLQVREQSRKDKVAYASAVIDRQIEPPRDSRRLQHLRNWSHEQDNEILPGSPGTRGSSVSGSTPGAR